MDIDPKIKDILLQRINRLTKNIISFGVQHNLLTLNCIDDDFIEEYPRLVLSYTCDIHFLKREYTSFYFKDKSHVDILLNAIRGYVYLHKGFSYMEPIAKCVTIILLPTKIVEINIDLYYP